MSRGRNRSTREALRSTSCCCCQPSSSFRGMTWSDTSCSMKQGASRMSPPSAGLRVGVLRSHARAALGTFGRLLGNQRYEGSRAAGHPASPLRPTWGRTGSFEEGLLLLDRNFPPGEGVDCKRTFQRSACDRLGELFGNFVIAGSISPRKSCATSQRPAISGRYPSTKASAGRSG